MIVEVGETCRPLRLISGPAFLLLLDQGFLHGGTHKDFPCSLPSTVCSLAGNSHDA